MHSSAHRPRATGVYNVIDPKAKKRFPGPRLKGRHTARRYLAYSPEFKELVRKNRGLLSEARKAIEKNAELIRAGKAVAAPNGIAIEPIMSAYLGASNALKCRVNAGGKSFFVKYYLPSKGSKDLQAETVAGHERLESYLSRLGHKYAEYKIRIAMPHLVTNNFTVTDFYGGEAEHVVSMKGPEFSGVYEALHGLKTTIASKYGERYDIGPTNAFYDKKSRTIILFDVW